MTGNASEAVSTIICYSRKNELDDYVLGKETYNFDVMPELPLGFFGTVRF